MNFSVIKCSLSIILCMGIFFSSAKAQNSINASGGKAFGTGGTQSYSIGQLVYSSTSGTGNSMQEGVQQAYIISTVTAIDDKMGIDLAIVAYPNPVKDFLKLNVKTSLYKTSTLRCQVCDVNGKTIFTKKFSNTDLMLNMSELLSATYYRNYSAPLS